MLVTGILVTLEYSQENVVDEAIEKKCNPDCKFHPLFFRYKKFTGSIYVERDGHESNCS